MSIWAWYANWIRPKSHNRINLLSPKKALVLASTVIQIMTLIGIFVPMTRRVERNYGRG